MKSKNKNHSFFYYLMGIFFGSLATITPLLLFTNISVKKEYSGMAQALKAPFTATKKEDRYPIKIRTRPPKPVIEELSEKGAAYDNTRLILHSKRQYHDSFMVQTVNEETGFYKLRPSSQARVYSLLAKKGYNLDPPLLFLNNKLTYSKKVKDYLASEATSEYKITSNGRGYRETYPKVRKDRKVLVVGDSVAFGLGVGDKDTFPSHLQKFLKKDYQVINAALNGYGSAENLQVLRNHKTKESIDHVIYIICMNDLMEKNKSRETQLKALLKKIGQFRKNYPRITVVLHSYMENVAAEWLYPQSFKGRKRQAYSFKKVGERMAQKHGFHFLSWYRIAEEFSQKKFSPFIDLSLYVDHCHFSSLGNKLLAQEVHARSFNQ